MSWSMKLDEGVVVFESKSIRSYLRHGYGGRRRAVDSNRDSKSLRAVRRMKGVSIMDIRSLARNAARSEHLRNVRRRSRPTKGKRSWSPAEQEKVKLLFPDKRSLEKALPHRTWIAIRSRAGALGLRKKQNRWLASDLSKLRRMWSAGATQHELCKALPRYAEQQPAHNVVANFHLATWWCFMRMVIQPLDALRCEPFLLGADRSGLPGERQGSRKQAFPAGPLRNSAGHIIEQK